MRRSVSPSGPTLKKHRVEEGTHPLHFSQVATVVPKAEQTAYWASGNFFRPSRGLLGLVSDEVKDAFGKPWIMTRATREKLLRHHIKVEGSTLIFQWDPLVQFGWALPIISGETGVGKTCGVLMALPDDCIGLYATPADFAHMWDEDLADFQPALNVIDYLLKTLIPDDVASIVRSGDYRNPKKLCLAIDDLGSYPKFLHWMWSIKGKDKHLDIPLTLVAICTGTDRSPRGPGSHPDYFHVVPVRANGVVWERIIKCAKGSESNVSKFLQAINDDNIGARELGGNSRAAALMVKVAQAIPSKALSEALSSKQARDALCETFFANVAKQYWCSTNVMRNVTDSEVQAAFCECARVVLFKQRDTLKKCESATLREFAQPLIHRYALLADEVQRSYKDRESDDFKMYPSIEYVAYKHLVAPFNKERGCFERYQMSTAHQTLFRLHYGSAPSHRSGGDGFVETCLQFLEFALLGARGCTVQELLQLLNGNHHAVGVDALGAVVLQYSAVRVLQSEARVQPGMTMKGSVLNEVNKFVKGGAAVVLRNATNTGFADVLVFLPNVGVVLVQTTSVQKESLEAQAVQEPLKMGRLAEKKAALLKKAASSKAASLKQAASLRAFHNVLRCAVQLSPTAAEPFVMRCLMTTQPRQPNVATDVLQFHATPRTIAPLKFRQLPRK